MGMVLRFEARRHGRASAGSRLTTLREANSVKRSGVTPPVFPVPESTIDCHHSGGMLSRCHHLVIADAGAPVSADIASRAPTRDPQALQDFSCQRSITARNESGSDVGAMDASVTAESLGRIVLKSKAILSHDCGQSFQDYPAAMARMSETEERLAFVRRVRMAREARFATQGPMLILLEIDQGTYKQYESRTPLPHRYIPKFCAATGVSMEWLLTGEGSGGPKTEEYPRQVQTRRPPKSVKGRAA